MYFVLQKTGVDDLQKLDYLASHVGIRVRNRQAEDNSE